jgi:hypothetical protein
MPGMAAACPWGVDSLRIMYPSTFGNLRLHELETKRVVRSQATEESVCVRNIMLAQE